MKSLPIRVALLLVVVLWLVFLTFMLIALTAGSLGGTLIFAPSVLFGAALIVLLFLWGFKGKKQHTSVIGVAAAVFLASGWYGFDVMFKFIQPTVLPKQVVPIGAPWIKGNNIFPDNAYTNPVVIKLNDGTYRMYFHDGNTMLTAASNDGQHFAAPTELFQGQMPTVIRLTDGRWRMYYFANADQPPQGQPAQPQPSPQTNCHDNCHGTPHNLVSAVSSDGLNWTQEPGVRLAAETTGYDRDTMIHPSVIRLDDGSFKLYYDGEIDPTSPFALVTHYRKILSASSGDGLSWTRDPGYRIDEKPVGTWEAYSPKALYENGKVVLHFTTPNGIYEATSTDTLTFAISKNPVFSPGRIPMPTDEGALGSYQDAYVLPDGGVNRIYFWIEGQGIFYASQQW